MAIPTEVIHLDPELLERLKKFLKPEDVSEPLLNLVRAGIAAHEHSFHYPETSKEEFLAFMADAWDGGVHQRKVYSMEVEGGLMNGYGVACNFAAGIAMWGKDKGLLPKEQEKAA